MADKATPTGERAAFEIIWKCGVTTPPKPRLQRDPVVRTNSGNKCNSSPKARGREGGGGKNIIYISLFSFSHLVVHNLLFLPSCCTQPSLSPILFYTIFFFSHLVVHNLLFLPSCCTQPTLSCTQPSLVLIGR